MFDDETKKLLFLMRFLSENTDGKRQRKYIDLIYYKRLILLIIYLDRHLQDEKMSFHSYIFTIDKSVNIFPIINKVIFSLKIHWP